jgi:endonuclease YncB( thermonuclease family)
MAGLLIAAVLFLRFLQPDGTDTGGDPLLGLEARCVRVIDGDTIDVESTQGRMRIRLIGIDAMDSHRAERVAEQARAHGVTERAVRGLSAKSTEFLRGRVTDRAVRLFPDPGQSDRDDYGRHLRYLELDGQDIGAEMLALGLAEPRRARHARSVAYRQAAKPLDWAAAALH